MIEPPLKSSPNNNMLPHSKEQQYTNSNQLTNLEIALHPPTRVQLKILMVDIWDMLSLSDVQTFRSIENDVHIGID